MAIVYINDSGHPMDEDDFYPYLILLRKELLKSGRTEEEIKQYIDSFFDDDINIYNSNVTTIINNHI